jgi:hypothetical protein
MVLLGKIPLKAHSGYSGDITALLDVHTSKQSLLPNWFSFHTVVTFPSCLKVLFLNHETIYKMEAVCSCQELYGKILDLLIGLMYNDKIILFSNC